MGARAARSADDRLADLFRDHHARVLAYAVRRVGPTAAPDIAAETYAVACRRLDVVPDGPDALPWLLATARNLVLAHVRSAATRARTEGRAAALDDAVRQPAPDPADAAADRAVVHQTLARLSESDRELMLLLAWDDLCFADVAVVLGCSVGAVRVRWLRARRRFADALVVEDEDPCSTSSSTDESPSLTMGGLR